MSATEEVLEEALDVAEKTMDALEETVRHIPYDVHLRSVVLVGIVAGCMGAGTAYYISKRVMKAKYEELMEKEIDEAREYYARLSKNEKFKSPSSTLATLHPQPNYQGDKSEGAVQEAADAIRAYQGEAEDEGDEEWEEETYPDDSPEEDDDEESSLNVFLQSETDDDWDIDAEMLSRTKEVPYVISRQEFYEGEPEYSQTSLTYYEGDKVLADEKEIDIPYPDPIVGIKNLELFGHGSGDSRVVYIRNERLSADYEIVKHDGKYAHEVLGLQHSDGGARGRQQRNEPRKFRGGDE